MTTATAPRTDTVAVTTSRSRSRRGLARTSPTQSKKSIVLSIVMALYLLYTLVPLFWLVINATKTQPDLFSTFGLWFGDSFALGDNIVQTLTYRDGIFLRWLGNTLLYVVVGAGGATLLATLAGYGLAKYNFRGRKAVFAVVLGAIAVPGTALAVRPSCSSASWASRTRPGRSSSRRSSAPSACTSSGCTRRMPFPPSCWKRPAWTGRASSAPSSPSRSGS